METLNREVFLFQYLNGADPKLLNVVVAKNSDDEIKAILGYVPSKYDSDKSDVFGALWKVSDDVKAPMLGLKLLSYLRNSIEGRYLSLGLNEVSSSIYRLVKFKVGYMSHWYIGNDGCNEYRIAKNIDFVLKW